MNRKHASPKEEIITFKVDSDLGDALSGIRNRSEFIRSALLAALEHNCPFCAGTGVLTRRQINHWKAFLKDHRIIRCRSCHSIKVVCSLRRRPSKFVTGAKHE